MIPFLVIALVMLAIACAWVLVPLLSPRRGNSIARGASNLAVLRDQRAELESDLANGVVSIAQFELARADLERRALDETEPGNAEGSVASRGGALTAALVGAAFPVAALLLYLGLGTPAALIPGLQPVPGNAQDAASTQEIETMIARVRARLVTSPDDLDGWKILARTYYALGRAQEAAGAYERATALAPTDADLLADYADVVGIAQGGSLDGRPEEIVARALRTNPGQWKANALAGTIAFQRRDYAKAIEHWIRVKATVPPDSPIAKSIDSSLAEARQLAGITHTNAAPASTPKPEKGSARIAGTVTLVPGLAGGVAPADTVFVFARPADGSRMPVALLRVSAGDLPLAFTLDDATAMLPDRRLSDHAEVIVGARVSKSGSATPQSGDLEATSSSVKLGATGVVLVIDRRVP